MSPMTLNRRRPPVEPDTSTYNGMVSARLRELRVGREWTVEELQDRLRREGECVPITTLYAWERGSARKGSDIPASVYPAIAKIFGYSTPAGWLPREWPE